MSIVESKSLLAKLLAEENIEVQHRQVPTAYFDVKNRTLVCPILKDMPSELYDLLMGHEVGHALFTPPEGWHNAVENFQHLPGFKSFLNIVEDARIERFVKNKFPGIRTSFYRGYKNLLDRDFFGINHLDVNTLPLIDRINLFFKGGSMSGVKFDTAEQEFVDMVSNTETWDDVLRVAEALYTYSKTEEPKTDQNDIEDESEEFEFDDSNLENEFDEMEESDSSDYEFIEKKLKKDPEAITDKNFRRREQEFLNDDAVNNIYCEVIPFDMTNRIIPHKVVHEHFKISRNTLVDRDLAQVFEVSVRKFLEKNERYINYMVKEFELRKNAKQFSRASVNKTGELDMQKISKYKLSEDLFKRVTLVPQGKNHGLLVYLDLSGSMRENMRGTVEQLLILTTFCRKVNIPFEVYGFSDKPFAYYLEGDARNNKVPLTDLNRKGTMAFDETPFVLKQYLTSKMSRLDYNSAMLNLLIMAEDIQRRNLVLASELLNGTPLNETIIASIEIANKFRKDHRLEVLTNVFLTDGESNGSVRGVVNHDGDVKGVRSFWFGAGYKPYNIVVTHKDSNSIVKISDEKQISKALLQVAKRATGANMVGFFIAGNQPYKTEVRKLLQDYGVTIPVDFDKQVSDARKNKFYPVTGAGYDYYFVVPNGSEMVVNDTGIQVGQDASKNDLRKAFMKTVQSRAANRVFLSRFCNTISQAL